MKDTIKRFLYICGYYKCLSLLRAQAEKRFIILMYHDIAADDDELDSILDRDRTTRSEFAAHLKVLKEKYRVISVEDAMEEIKSIGHFKEDSIAITFDDGYSSVYNIAFPLLRQYRFPATVYLTTDWINKKISLWWEELASIMKAVEFEEVRPNDLEELLGIRYSKDIVESFNMRVIRKLIYRETSAFLRGIDDNKRGTLLDRLRKLVSAGNAHRFALPKPLSWEEIAEMADDNINFGAHTCTHINVRYADMELVEREISNSKEEIERQINKGVRGFAFPYGQDLSAYITLEPFLERHDFNYACTAYPGNNDPPTHPFRLRRIALPHTKSPLLLKRYLCLCIITDNSAPDEY